MKKRYYLAYGSNLNIRQMHLRCPEARIVGTTVIPGYELLFKGSKTGAYLTIERNPKESVPAAVWATTAVDEAALDRYEGCPAFYYKTELTLSVKGLRDGREKELSVYVYIMHEERLAGMPSISYVETCLEGYRDFDLPDEYLWRAIQRTRRLCHEGTN